MDFYAFTNGVFENKLVKDFPVRDRQIVEIDADAQISEAFNSLLTHNVQCCPVWDTQQEGYLGFFDVTDALSISYDIDLISKAQDSSKEEKLNMKTSAVQVFQIFNKQNQIRDNEVPWVAVRLDLLFENF
jgi:predicted transcriptional regulator